MQKIEIRRASLKDLDVAVKTWERARRQAEPWLEERLGYTHEDNLYYFEHVVMKKNQVWLAVEGRKILGLMALSDGNLDQLHVDPHHQGKGVGSLLLELAKELSPEGLMLYTHQRNERARVFYERRGFTVRKLGVSPPPESEPDVQYTWTP